jgi:hypothetical protein
MEQTELTGTLNYRLYTITKINIIKMKQTELQ